MKGGKIGGETGSKFPAKSRIQDDQVTIPPQYPSHPVFRNAIARHYEQIAITDAQVGAIIAALERYKLLQNTAVFFFTDHGSPLPRAKQFLYEDGTKVPLIVHWPAGNQSKVAQLGHNRHDLVSGIDIPVTSLRLAGIEVPKYMEGLDLFDDAYQPREYLISVRDRMGNAIDRIRSVTSKRYRYIRNFQTDRALYQPQYRDTYATFTTLRDLFSSEELTDLQASYFVVSARPAEELYDLQSDPHQTSNLATIPNYKSVLQKHKAFLDRWIRTTDDKGQYPESKEALELVFKSSVGKCVNPEYDFLKSPAAAAE